MAELSVPAVVPSSNEAPGASAGAGTVSAGKRSLSLPGLAPEPQTVSLVAAIASVDGRGRVAELSVVRALGWYPGMRVQCRPVDGLVLVRPDPAGLFTVTGQGYVRLPAPVRHWCGLAAGDRVLAAARPAQDVLIVHPMAAVQALLAEQHVGLGVDVDDG